MCIIVACVRLYGLLCVFFFNLIKINVMKSERNKIFRISLSQMSIKKKNMIKTSSWRHSGWESLECRSLTTPYHQILGDSRGQTRAKALVKHSSATL